MTWLAHPWLNARSSLSKERVSIDGKVARKPNMLLGHCWWWLWSLQFMIESIDEWSMIWVRTKNNVSGVLFSIRDGCECLIQRSIWFIFRFLLRSTLFQLWWSFGKCLTTDEPWQTSMISAITWRAAPTSLTPVDLSFSNCHSWFATSYHYRDFGMYDIHA